MKIFVRAKVKAKNPRVKRIDETHFEVSVREPPIEGRANKAVIAALADHFGMAKSRIKMVSGETSRQKILEIL